MEFDTKKKILLTSLPHIEQLGWSFEALKRGCLDGGQETWNAERYFTTPIEAFEFWSDLATLHMNETCPQDFLAPLKVRERIETLILARLHFHETHPKALSALLSKEGLNPRSLKKFFQGVSAIWYQGGDTSTDYNYYTKRLLLAYVYGRVILYWKSQGYPNPEMIRFYVRDRIEEVLKVGGVIHKVKTTLSPLTSKFNP